MSFLGSSSGMGTDTFMNYITGTTAAYVSDGTMGNATGNPGPAYWLHNWASPVQGYATVSKSGTSVTQWPTAFTALGSSGGVSIGPLQIGNTGVLPGTDKSYFTALYSPPTVLGMRMFGEL